MRFLVLSMMLALALSGCGRRGAPLPPGPAADVTFPHVYPAN
jgi:predicted small lipoprotein YifL